jgi:hypothetical protein
LSLAQYEMLVGASNPAVNGFPLLMMMLYCLALLGRSRPLRYALLLTLNFLLIYTGYGLFMGAVTIGVFLLECYWSWRQMSSVPFAQPLTAFFVAAASLASFFVHYTFSPGVDCFQVPHRHLLQYARFTALIFWASVVPRPLHVSSAMTVLGAAILVVVVSILVSHLFHLVRSASSTQHLVSTGALELLPAVLSDRRRRTSLPWHGRGICIALRDSADSFVPRHLLLSVVEVLVVDILVQQAKSRPRVVGSTPRASRSAQTLGGYPLVLQREARLGQLLRAYRKHPLLRPEREFLGAPLSGPDRSTTEAGLS